MLLLQLLIQLAVAVEISAKVDPVDEFALHRARCSLGLGADSMGGARCPVDGGWGTWGSWGACGGDCDATGRRRRRRECNNPTPGSDGAPCVGLDTEIENCQLLDCTMDDYAKVVTGDPLRCAQYEKLKKLHEKYPALVEKCFATDCSYAGVEEVLHEGAAEYWNALHCVKHNMGCPVHGSWSAWCPWSSCSAQCGLGARHRTRQCNNPPPTEKDLHCEGEHFESEKCHGQNCAHNLDGFWIEWSDWGPCVPDCGPGITRRARTCESPASQPKGPLELCDNLATLRVKLLSKRVLHTRGVDWGSKCSGADEEYKACDNQDCAVNGGWSDWTQWSPCSKKCGHGARSRNRMCSNPSASGAGQPCVGPATETERCYDRPCGSRAHEVAVFAGRGSLLYAPAGRPCRLLHVYIRFLTLTPFGVLMHRHSEDCAIADGCDYVRISLQGGALVLLATIQGCAVAVIHQDKLSVGEWHEVLISVLGTEATMRVDNSKVLLRSNFTCEAVKPNLDHSMLIGQRLRGQIQQVAINFSPVLLHREKAQGRDDQTKGSAPYASSNVIYEMGDIEEGYKKIGEKLILEAPCPTDSKNWMIEMAMKPVEENGLILLMTPDNGDSYLIVRLDASRVKMRIFHGEYKSEVSSGVDILPGKWLHILLRKDSSLGEVSIRVNGGSKRVLAVGNSSAVDAKLCDSDFYIGDIPQQLKGQLDANLNMDPLDAMVGYLSVDDVSQDLESLPEEDEFEEFLSSERSSYADRYEELPMLLGQQLNLSCLYDKSEKHKIPGEPGSVEAKWMRLDVPVHEVDRGGIFTVNNDGRLTHLTSSSYNTLSSVEGFYSCRIRPPNSKSRILVAFGVPVIDPAKETASVHWTSWVAVGILTAVLLAIHILWMLVELYKDWSRGYGFFRSKRYSPRQELDEQLMYAASPEAMYLLGGPKIDKKHSHEKQRKRKQRQNKDPNGRVPQIEESSLPPVPRRK